jgi:hypothetical protein
MRIRPNIWAIGAVLFCVAAWSAVSIGGVKVTGLYSSRGPKGFRHAVGVRLDKKIGEFRAVMTGVRDEA